jgi:hypothetical protein
MLDNKTPKNYIVFTKGYFSTMASHSDNSLPVEATWWALNLIFDSNSQNSLIDLDFLIVLHPRLTKSYSASVEHILAHILSQKVLETVKNWASKVPSDSVAGGDSVAGP